MGLKSDLFLRAKAPIKHTGTFYREAEACFDGKAVQNKFFAVQVYRFVGQNGKRGITGGLFTSG